MSLRHRRGDSKYNDWRRNCSWNRRLNLGSFGDGYSNQRNNNTYSRPLLPRNQHHFRPQIIENNYHEQIDLHGNNDKNKIIPKGARGKWRQIAWNLLRNSASNLSSEIANVVTSNLVEFGVAVVTAYISQWFFG